MKKTILLSFLFMLFICVFAQKKKAEHLLESGNEKFNLKDYSGAIADYSEAIIINPKFAEAYYKRGVTKSWLGDNYGAIDDLAEAMKHKHNYKEAYFESAYIKYEVKNYQGAIDDYNKVIELNPQDRDAYYNRALAKYNMQDYSGCIIDNNKTIEIDPKYVNAYYSRSLARYEMKDYQGTLVDNLKVLELDPGYTNAHYNIGLSYYGLQNYTSSIESYNKVIQASPDYSNAYYNRGLAKHYVKDYAGAIFDFTRVIELTPHDAESYYRRGLSRYFIKDYAGSVNDYEKALALKPEYEEVKTELTFASAELKKAPRATEDAANNIDINVKLPQIWAVIVGVSAYKDTKINLKYADKDASDFYHFLKSPQGGSLPDDHIALLTNEKATRSNIIKALNEKFYRAFEDDIVILFIASHGQPDPVGNEVYFLCHDAETDNLGGTAVSQIDIEKVFQRTKANKKLWIADACHSGGAGLQVRAVDHSTMTNKLLTQIANSNNGMAMFTASSSSEYSYEDQKWGGGHGVFTHYLLKGMSGEADKDNNGMVEIRELYEFVYRQVSNETNGQQHPELKGSFDNKLPISIHK